MVPEETVFFVEVDDLKGISDSIKSGPLGELSQSNAWDKIGNWVEGKMQSELGEDSDDIELLFERMKEWEESMNGSAVLAIGSLEKMLSKKMPDITLLMETDFSKKKLNDTLKWIKKEVISSGGKFSWEREKIAGEEVHWIGSDPTKEKNEQMAIFLSGQTLGLLLGGKDHVKDTLLRAADNASVESLARNNNYLDLFEEIEKGSARIFLDFEALQELIEDLGSIPKMQIPENPFFTLPARAARATIGAMPKSDPDAPGPFAFRDPERVNAILSEAGFADITCEVTALDLTPAGSVDDLAQQMCDIGPASGAITHFEASPAQVAELRQTIADALAPYAQNGSLRLPAEINFVTATKP